MIKKKFLVPFVFTIFTYTIIWITLNCRLIFDTEKIGDSLSNVRTDIITVSGIISGLIIAYLTSRVLQIREERLTKLPDIFSLTQKLHKFRAIVNKIIHSNIWLQEVKHLVDNEYKNLTYFELRDIVFVNGKSTKLASSFSQEHEISDTKNFYLELKSLISSNKQFDETLYSEFDVDLSYDSKLLGNWLKYNVGNGFYYYFEHKYAVYMHDLNLLGINIDAKEEIKNLAIQIDKERYSQLPLDNTFFSKLGQQVTSDILPKLYTLQSNIEKGLPSIIIYLFIILCLFLIFGVLLPLLSKAYMFPPIFDVISVSTISSLCIFFISSFLSVLKQEIKLF